MTEWHPQLLVNVNDHYDREYASNAEFAVHAWRTATAPIMSPGYAQIRPDLHSITLHRDDDDGSLYADIHIPLRHFHIGGGKRLPYTWQDWETESNHSSDEYPTLLEPRSSKRPAVLTTAIVRVSGHDWPRLVTPSAYEGRALLDEAREAVTTLAGHINDDAGPMVAKLLS